MVESGHMTEREEDVLSDVLEVLDNPEERHAVSITREQLRLISNKFKDTHRRIGIELAKEGSAPAAHIDLTHHTDGKASLIKDQLVRALSKSRKTASPSAQLVLGATDLDIINIYVVPYLRRAPKNAALKEQIVKKEFVFTNEVQTLVFERTIQRERAVLALNKAWEQAGGKPRDTFLKRRALFPKNP